MTGILPSAFQAFQSLPGFAGHRLRVGERLVYATTEFKTRKEGAQLLITEQGVFLDDFDDARWPSHPRSGGSR